MPKATLDAAFVRTVACPGKGKIDYYDNAITGFILEVRSSGGKTYHLRYRDAHGKQCQHKIGDAKSISFDKARTSAEKLRSRVVLGESPIEEKKMLRTIPTLAELYRDTYLPHLQNTRRNMGSDLSFWKVHLLPGFGHKHLDELKPQEISDAQKAMRKDGYAAGTSNKWIVQIRYAYAVAKKFGIPGSDVNPAAGLKQFQVEGRERFLSKEETQRLRDAVEQSENTQLKYIVALLLMLGCRKRELLDAKWEHFDLERRNWRIPLSKSGKSRNVPLSSAVVETLAQLPRWSECPYVLPNPMTRKPFTGIHVAWDTARKRAGLPGVRMHDLRHTFASNLVNAGHSLFVVSKALGHTNTLMTQRYSHLSDETLFAAADAAANAIGPSWTEAKQVPA